MMPLQSDVNAAAILHTQSTSPKLRGISLTLNLIKGFKSIFLKMITSLKANREERSAKHKLLCLFEFLMIKSWSQVWKILFT